MKYFVTGGSGWIGSKVVEYLIEEGHEVTALARSQESAKKLTGTGAKVVVGSLSDIEIIVEAAKKADGTLHLAFTHDFTDLERGLKIDETFIESVCNAYVGTNKLFIGTGGTLYLSGPNETNEETVIDPAKSPMGKRALNEKLALSYAEKGVRVVQIRLAPTVHGKGDKGFIPMIISADLKNKQASYPEDGENVWPAVHRDDAARLYILAAVKAPPGSILHGNAEFGVKTRDIAEAIAKSKGIEAKSVAKEEIAEKLGPLMGFVFALNNFVSSEKTKKITGWEPKGPKLLEDIHLNY